MDKMDSCPYIEDGRLLDYAASAAMLLRPQDNCAGAEAAALLRRDFLEIRRSHQAVEKRYGKLAGAPAACQWLLDNWYMVQREYPYAASQLKAAKNLRCSPEGIMIMELCRVLVKAGQGQVTEERCAAFLEGFQSVTVLARRELELFPAALRCAIIEGIADVCRRLRYVSDTADCAQAFGRLFTSLRLFAVLESLQQSANPGINATIRDRYFNSACATPAQVFPTLIKLAQNHLNKLDDGLSIYYDKRMSDLCGRLTESLPKHLTLEEQGVFQLGYYHQRQALFTKKEEKENG